MSHLIKNKPRLVARVRRLIGQLEAVERALDTDAACGEILNQVASIRGAVGGLTAELIEAHVREHILNAAGDEERRDGADELMDAVRTYLK
jgi:DNA-binding FrmR family transcriptional regulator